MKFLSPFLIILVVIFIVLFAYTWFILSTKLRLHASAATISMPEGMSASTQFVKTSDGVKIAYWYFPVTQPKALVILVHGYSNPGGKSQMLGVAKFLHDAGYSTALLDLRSFGESEGNKISLGTQEWKDVEALHDHLKTLPENSQTKIGFLGISMGATTSLVTAGKTGKGDFVIASVPFADIDSLYHFQIQAMGYPTPIFSPLVKLAGFFELGLRYDQSAPSSLIQNIHAPILLISAKQDHEVHPEDAVKLFEKANDPKELWVVDSEHDVFYFHTKEFTQKVLGFLQKYSK